MTVDSRVYVWREMDSCLWSGDFFGRGDEFFGRNGLKRMKIRETILFRLHKVIFVFAHSNKLCWLHE